MELQPYDGIKGGHLGQIWPPRYQYWLTTDKLQQLPIGDPSAFSLLLFYIEHLGILPLPT